MLARESFGPDDPLFPATAMGHDKDRSFVAQGLSKDAWSTSEPIRRIFKRAFENAGLPSIHPHRTRRTLALHADLLDLTREQEKAYSMNFGHETIWTTRESYGNLPQQRQAAIMRSLSEPKKEGDSNSAIAAIEEALGRLKASKNLPFDPKPNGSAP